MCGINGFTCKDAELIQRMNVATAHRGPDQNGIWCGDTISLGNNRLAIIDLTERGRQPMWDANKRYVIVFNGEIYNYQDIRAELIKKYKFNSESDTEVIINAFKEYGPACLNKLNGIFAFAIWDTQKQELFLARDPIGIKPLYYYQAGDKLIFSSEIKAILEHTNVPRAVDKEAFNLYFSVLYVPEPYTMFKDIKKFPAGHHGIFKNGKLTTTRYWQISNQTDLSSRQDATKRIRELFDDSVKRQLVSERPVGVYLSGGLDSTAVLGSVCAAKHEQVKTFSIGFDIANDKFNADFRLAKETAKFYKTDHHEFVLSVKDVQNTLEEVAWHLDEPNFNPTAVAQYVLSREAKKTVTVVLGGDGGDELFGGYPRYYFSRLISQFQKLPRTLQSVIRGVLKVSGKRDQSAKLSLPRGAERVGAFLAQPSNVLSEVLSPHAVDGMAAARYFSERFFSANNSHNPSRYSYDSHQDFEKQFMNVDRQSWLVDESLLRTDKMTMAWGIEERVPILDYRLVELSQQLPTAWKFSLLQNPNHFQGKAIWREAIADYLPPHVLNERKRGWFTPMAKWLRGDLREFAEAILKRLPEEYFNQVGVMRVWQDHLSSKRYNLNVIWAMIMWQLWYERFIARI